jgi:hypothetical protein
MNDEPCRQPCRNEPGCDTCDELFCAVAPCIDCRELGIHHYVNMLDETCRPVRRTPHQIESSTADDNHHQ